MTTDYMYLYKGVNSVLEITIQKEKEDTCQS
jgi:hypothetical protein